MTRPAGRPPKGTKGYAQGKHFASHFHVLPPAEAAAEYAKRVGPFGSPTTTWARGFRKGLAQIMAEHKARGHKAGHPFAFVREFHAEFAAILPIVERRGMRDPDFIPLTGSSARFPVERLRAYKRPVLLSAREGEREHPAVNNLANQLGYFSLALREGEHRMLSHSPAPHGAFVYVRHTARGTEKIIQMGGEFRSATPAEEARGALFMATNGNSYHFLRSNRGKLYFWYSEGEEEMWGDEIFRDASPSQAGTGPSGSRRRQ